MRKEVINHVDYKNVQTGNIRKENGAGRHCEGAERNRKFRQLDNLEIITRSITKMEKKSNIQRKANIRVNRGKQRNIRTTEIPGNARPNKKYSYLSRRM